VEIAEPFSSGLTQHCITGVMPGGTKPQSCWHVSIRARLFEGAQSWRTRGNERAPPKRGKGRHEIAIAAGRARRSWSFWGNPLLAVDGPGVLRMLLQLSRCSSTTATIWIVSATVQITAVRCRTQSCTSIFLNSRARSFPRGLERPPSIS